MSGPAVALLGWCVLGVAGLALAVAARRGAVPAPPADALCAAMRTAPGRVAVLVSWLWLGVHFLAR